MILKKVNLFLVVFFTLLFSTNVLFTLSQSGNPNDFNRSIKVHVGDSARYDILKETMLNQNYIPFSFFSKNGSSYVYNLTQGDILNIKVVETNSSPSIYSNIDVVAPNKVTHLQMIHSELFITFGFNSYTDVKSYINQANQNSNSSYSINGDMLTTTYNFTTTISNNSFATVHFFNSYNWKTGWLENIHNKGTFTNGSNYFEVIIQRHHINNIFSTLLNYSINLFEIGFLFIVTVTIVILVLSYGYYTKHSNKSQSFKNYIRNGSFLRKRKTQKKSITTTSEALQTIESILDETRENNK